MKQGRWVLVLGFACGLLGGCVPIPYPIPPLGYESYSRHNVPGEVPSTVIKGQTSREDVLFALGEPDTARGSDSEFIYESEFRQGGIGAVVLFPGGGGLLQGQGVRVRRLGIHFDGAGIVEATRIEISSCKKTYAETMTRPITTLQCPPSNASQ